MSTAIALGPETISRAELSNGIVLLTTRTAHTGSLVIQGRLDAGSARDPLDKLGLADFTAGLLNRGTQLRAFTRLHEELESRAASLNFSSGHDGTVFRARALAEDAAFLFTLLAECLIQPSFPPEYMERYRAQLLTALAMRDQEPGGVAGILLDEMIFPNHPYGRPEDGIVQTIQSIQRTDIIDFHARHYGPARLLVSVAGALEAHQVIELAEKTLGVWVNPMQSMPLEISTPTRLKDEKRRHQFIPDKSQSEVLMATLGPRRKDSDFLDAYVGNHILGVFGLMGRIGDSVREKAGLAYYAASSLIAGAEAGVWEFSAGVNPKNRDRAIALMKEEIHRFASEPVSAEELADSQAFLIGSLPMALESNNGLAAAMLNMERYQLGLDYQQRYPDLVRAVTRESVLAAGKRHLDAERLAIASAGPGEDIA